MRKNWFSDREKLLKSEGEGREFAFLTCSWRFLISNKLKQLEYKLEKIIGISKHAGKVRKSFSPIGCAKNDK